MLLRVRGRRLYALQRVLFFAGLLARDVRRGNGMRLLKYWLLRSRGGGSKFHGAGCGFEHDPRPGPRRVALPMARGYFRGNDLTAARLDGWVVFRNDNHHDYK